MLNSSNEKNNLRRHDKRDPIDIKLILIFEHSQLETKKENIRSKWWLRQLWRLLDAPTCEEGILIKGSKLILQGQGGPKRRWVDFKRSLVEAIVPSAGTQPSAHLQIDGARASMQGGHHLHTCTASTSQGVSYGKRSHNSQHSVVI